MLWGPVCWGFFRKNTSKFCRKRIYDEELWCTTKAQQSLTGLTCALNVDLTVWHHQDPVQWHSAMLSPATIAPLSQSQSTALCVRALVVFFFWYTPHWHTPVLYKTSSPSAVLFQKTICSKDHVRKKNKLNKLSGWKRKTIFARRCWVTITFFFSPSWFFHSVFWHSSYKEV